MVGLFIWGRWRYDAISLGVLSIFVLLGYIQPEEAFKGFSHPAVITVALVLLISKGLERSGFISVIGRKLQAYANSEVQSGGSITFVPTTTNFASANNRFGYTVILSDSDVGTINVVRPAPQQAAASVPQFIGDNEAAQSITVSGLQFEFQAKNQLIADKSATILVIGNETGGRTSFNVTVKKLQVASFTAAPTANTFGS